MEKKEFSPQKFAQDKKELLVLLILLAEVDFFSSFISRIQVSFFHLSFTIGKFSVKYTYNEAGLCDLIIKADHEHIPGYLFSCFFYFIFFFLLLFLRIPFRIGH